MSRTPVAVTAVGLLVLTLGGSIPSGRARSTSSSSASQAAVAAPQEQDVDALRETAKTALAPVDGEVTVDGLQQPVEVIRDRWGVPHVYATSVDDLFTAQGFVAAQDRLWQLELWKRTAEGTLAEILGPSAVARDTFARLLRYRGNMDAEWASYSPDARRIVRAFVNGINAQVAHVLAHPEQLPLEFQLTGIRPSPWTPEVVISRMAGYSMTRNARSEVARARLAQRVGVGRVAEYMPPDPAVPITLPQGLELDDITAEVLQLAEAADAPLEFGDRPATRAPAFGLFLPRATRRGDGGPLESLERLEETYATVGSNNWAIGGALSATGKPLLANDPHRALQLPSLRYTVHLNGPGWNVIGAGEPALPGVAAGHNETVAFGFTIVGIDQQDLYVERLDPSSPDRYLFEGTWETMRVEREDIRVKGEATRSVELRFTRHGPVVHLDRARNRAYALRWVGSEPGTAGYLAALSLNVAKNWPEFLAAAARWKVPSENLVYADAEGNIGWVAAGLAPRRSAGHGLLPVPGHEGRYEWQGFLPLRELPQSLNPSPGFVATANHNILPAGYRHALGYEWAPPHRFGRIVEVLTSRRGFTVQDFEHLQHDELSIPARTIIEALRVAATVRPIADRDRAAAAAMLSSWDAVLDQLSPAAALYALWLPHLRLAFAEAIVPQAEKPYVSDRISVERLLAILRRPSQKDLDVLTGPALSAAMAEARERMGDDPRRWAWGRLHQAAFEHALATTSQRRAVLNLPPVPRGGDGSTVNNTGYALRQVHGASFRQVLDLSDWNRSTTINVPGASGQPGSPFYDNWLPRWAAGQYHPMLFTRDVVERFAAARLWLRPSDWTDPMPTADAAEAPPVLPEFLGTLVNYDRHDERVAACMREPGDDVVMGARLVPRTFVWVIERDQARQLGSVPGSCDPAWSPDGSRLAVVTTNGLWTYSPTLEEPQQLAEAHLPREPKHESDYTAFSKPAWSPDGLRLAYLVTNGATSWVEVVEVATGRPLLRSEKDTYSFEWTSDPRVIKVGISPVRLPR